VLQVALEKGHDGVIELLLGEGVNVNAQGGHELAQSRN
jgi:hypothetical protein